MENVIKLSKRKTLSVLVIGNNPMDLGLILDKLNQIKKTKLLTEIAFDMRSVADRLKHFSPSCILIDDNVGAAHLQQIYALLRDHKKTALLPVTILKNNNTDSGCPSIHVWDYVLKQNWSAQSLITGLENAMLHRRHQHFYE